jgi:hypothetical protein
MATKTTDAPAPVPADPPAAHDLAPTELPPAQPEPGATPSADPAVPAPAEPTPAPTTHPTPTTKPETATAPAEEEEPQNSLTKKFSEAEWNALKDFRVRGPLLPFTMANFGFNSKKYHRLSLMRTQIAQTPNLRSFNYGASRLTRMDLQMLKLVSYS